MRGRERSNLRENGAFLLYRLGRSPLDGLADWNERCGENERPTMAQVLISERRINDEIEGEFGCRYLRGEEDPGCLQAGLDSVKCNA